LEKNGLAVDMYEGIKPSPMIYEYRNKMEYSFGDYIKGGELTLGLHKSGRFMDILTTDE
ncbi:MAG TPA: 23S rRNA (uracil(1939)-C(5))-methyltransferase RlmD, partial [Clostridiales bacterium]|nr:23S rRNA (uracil(1939)-C(5))-methyltransferase RlmD [Clostridiales bacterium]